MAHLVFGSDPAYELQLRERRLLADGQLVPLGSRALDVLVVLATRAGQVVSRRELLDGVWPDTAVEDNNLTVQVHSLRKVLGSALIATVPGRGYSFTPTLQQPRMPAAGALQPGHWHARLPATLPTLFGREADLASLKLLLGAHRLVSLLGPGGIGKTVLAQHLLRAVEDTLPHGGCFVDLSTVSTAADIPGEIAAALQVSMGSGTALDGLVRAVAPLSLTLVLDNAERLHEAVAQVAQALLQSAPGVRMLVTSQVPLKLAAERQFRLQALAVPARPLPAAEALSYGAVALFVDRAQATDARFALDDTGVAAVVELCTALGGLPLAIELAAWRAPILGVRQLADSMHRPLRLLQARHLDTPARLQTLRGALAWSYGLLHPGEQQVFRRMAVLRGSSGLALIRQVADPGTGDAAEDDWLVLEALSTLVERSLVAAVPGPDGSQRYSLLDGPRSFALELLAAGAELTTSSQRHAEAVARHFGQAYADRFSGRERLDAWEARCLADLENGHAALAWLRQHDQAGWLLQMLPGLLLATPREAQARHRDMCALVANLVPQQPPGAQAVQALVEAAHVLSVYDLWLGHALAERGVDIARRCRAEMVDDRWLYRALCQLSITHLVLGNLAAGQACLDEARALERPDWPAVCRRLRWLAETWLADRRGDGLALYQASLALHRLALESGFLGWAGGLNFVNGAVAAGRFEEAVAHGLAVVAQLETTRHLGALAETRTQLAGALIACGRVDEARQQNQAAWPHVVQLSRVDVWADYQALLAALQGRLADAARLQGYADQLCHRLNIQRAHNELHAAERTRALVCATLTGDRWQALLAEGARLHEADIPAIAFGDTGPGANSR